MSDTSPRLGLNLPVTIDDFSTAVIRSNWEKIDAAPGCHIGTSAERAALSWGAGQIGRSFYETNTGLEWVWQGGSTGWVRKAGTGLLKTAGGQPAFVERVTDFTTNSLTFFVVTSITGVVIPAGNRPIKVEFFRQFDQAWSGSAEAASNNGQELVYSFARSAVNNTTLIGPQWFAGTNANSYAVHGGSDSILIPTGYAAGTYNFSIQAHLPSNASSPRSLKVNAPIRLAVYEL